MSPPADRLALFIAIGVPGPLQQRLLALQPASSPAVVLADASDLHLTLHYLGSTAAERVPAVVDELRTISAGPFDLLISGVGSFAGRRQSTFLWAGVEPSPPLLSLHREIGAVVRRLGFGLDERPYRPHITLARIDGGSDEAVKEFLTAPGGQALHEAFRCEAFALYRSGSRNAEGHYQSVAVFPLIGGRGD